MQAQDPKKPSAIQILTQGGNPAMSAVDPNFEKWHANVVELFNTIKRFATMYAYANPDKEARECLAKILDAIRVGKYQPYYDREENYTYFDNPEINLGITPTLFVAINSWIIQNPSIQNRSNISDEQIQTLTDLMCKESVAAEVIPKLY